jgi:hypothetical protein
MSFLTPLYALGFLAVAAPIVFHLIRRMPRGEVPFSSLMFLTPSPPRLTRRSKLDQWLLLLLRATALILLALAFMRPFLRQEALADLSDAGGRRIAVLIDTSASMRRADLWPRARQAALDAIDGCKPADRLAVFAFDASAHRLLGFEESDTLDPPRRQAVATARLQALEPSWRSTDLGRALLDALAELEDAAERSKQESGDPGRIVLVTDLQQGSRFESLGEREWPRDVELDVKTISQSGSNAGLHSLLEGRDAEPGGPDQPVGVRVSNDSSSHRESFELLWLDSQGGEDGKPIPVYVPPGESRVARVPRLKGLSEYRGLRLKGDTDAFDNTLYLAAEPRRQATVLFVGADGPDDPAGMLYFLNRIFPETPGRIVRVRAVAPTTDLVFDPGESVPLVVLAAETKPDNLERLRKFMDAGGTVLHVLTVPQSARVLAALTGATAAAADFVETAPNRGALLTDIAFDHRFFAPLAAPQYSDFTKIRFWKYRRLNSALLGEARTLARFDTGDPAVVEKSFGKGRLVVLASGWAPADSQIARSSKFFPLMSALIESPDAAQMNAPNRLVGDRVLLPQRARDAAKRLTVAKPDGSNTELAAASASFDGTDQPGIYKVLGDTGGAPAFAFAVNLDPLESKTSPLSLETLEQFGCRLANQKARDIDHEQLRQMQSAELEGRQKLWRFLVLGAIGILLFETWLAGRSRRTRTTTLEVMSI